MPKLLHPLTDLKARIVAASAHTHQKVELLAISKMQSTDRIQAIAQLGQAHFGENYIQEALPKMKSLGHLGLIWHMIGPLQSNKCHLAAQHFDWIESIDRSKIVALLAKNRPSGLAPLNVLVQVNVDQESSKSGCQADMLEPLCALIAEHKELKLRGLMGIPTPYKDPEQRRPSFRKLRTLFDNLKAHYPFIDTLSMGMSDDFEIAIQEGATQVRIGTALFGPRPL
jgi:pyridoxal phosphate enzyme (YggS family)